MRLTECPCGGCEKRKKANEEGNSVKEHIIAVKNRYRKGSIKYTPKKNGAIKK